MKESNSYQINLAIVSSLLILYWIWAEALFIYTATLLGVLSTLFPKAGRFMAMIWQKLATYIAWFNTQVLLAMAFYCVLTPVALIYRLFHQDPLQLKENRSQKSLFKERKHFYVKEDLENPW